jgi:hypothetical protein
MHRQQTSRGGNFLVIFAFAGIKKVKRTGYRTDKFPQRSPPLAGQFLSLGTIGSSVIFWEF